MIVVDASTNTPPVLIFNATLPGSPYASNDECESYPFEVSDRIVVNGKQYRHLVTLMSATNHFWAVVNIDSNIYYGGVTTDQTQLIYQGPAPFVAQKSIWGQRTQSNYHIYGACEDAHPDGDRLTELARGTKSRGSKTAK
jgi:hypothetical protein